MAARNALSSPSPAASASPDDCINILESFLHDMDALDRQQEQTGAIEAKEETNNPKISKIRTKKKQSWLKRKQELSSLREETRALETHVKFLKTKQEVWNSLIPEKEILKQWKIVENHRRQAAQDENQRLQCKMRAYLTQMKALQRAFQSTERERRDFLMQKSLRVEMGAARHLNLDTDALFSMLEGCVDKRFQERQLSFCAEMPKVSTSPDSELVLDCYDRNKGKIALTREQLLPFAKSAIVCAAWKIVAEGRLPDGQNTRAIYRRSRDTCAMKGVTTVNLEGGDIIHLSSIIVLKRFLVSKGFVIMVEARSEWIGNCSAPGAWSHLSRERGCFVAREYFHEANVASGICQLSSELEMEASNSTQTNHYPLANSSTVHDIVIPSFRQLTTARNQFMENALFDIIRAQG